VNRGPGESFGGPLKEPLDGEQDPLAALRAGHPGPFEAFVASHTSRLMAFFLRSGASPIEAEDLVQELFLKLFQQSQHYESQGRFFPYVLRVARNAWIDRVRRSSVRGAQSLAETEDRAGPGNVEWAQSREVDPGTSAGRREQLATLRLAWSSLPEPQRLVFELGVLQERSYLEISEILDVPVGTVKSRMFYALRRLRGQAEASSGGQRSSDSEGRR